MDSIDKLDDMLMSLGTKYSYLIYAHISINWIVIDILHNMIFTLYDMSKC